MQLTGSQVIGRLTHLAFGMNPAGFHRIEAGAFGWQTKDQQALDAARREGDIRLLVIVPGSCFRLETIQPVISTYLFQPCTNLMPMGSAVLQAVLLPPLGNFVGVFLLVPEGIFG